MKNLPLNADIVGSFLRTDCLKDARAKFEFNEITKRELRSVEDEEITLLVEKQKQNGLRVVTDGEFRRRYWHLDFLSELDGVEEVKAEHWSVAFKGHQPKAATLKIIDKIDFSVHSFVEDFKFLKNIAGDSVAKQTIPSPSMLHLIPCVRAEDYEPIERYRDNEDLLFTDITNAYIKAVNTFYEAGCRYLQLDDTSWGEFCDEEKIKNYKERGFDLNHIAKKYVEVINNIVEAKPSDMTITMHICRGNFRSTWFSSGGYAPVGETLFGNCNVDGFFLEFDDERSGDFEPLKYIKNQKVVLGLISSKLKDLENPELIKARINEASKYVDIEQLCLSPQCGFSSTEEGNNLTEDEQWAKIRLVVEIAKEVWNVNSSL